MRCLIVDDDPMSRSVIEHFVTQTDGLDLLKSCADGIEAANVLQQEDK